MKKNDRIDSQMVKVQEAIIALADKMKKDDKQLNDLAREFTKLKAIMYGVDNG